MIIIKIKNIPHRLSVLLQESDDAVFFQSKLSSRWQSFPFHGISRYIPSSSSSSSFGNKSDEVSTGVHLSVWAAPVSVVVQMLVKRLSLYIILVRECCSTTFRPNKNSCRRRSLRMLGSLLEFISRVLSAQELMCAPSNLNESNLERSSQAREIWFSGDNRVTFFGWGDMRRAGYTSDDGNRKSKIPPVTQYKRRGHWYTRHPYRLMNRHYIQSLSLKRFFFFFFHIPHNISIL